MDHLNVPIISWKYLVPFASNSFVLYSDGCYTDVNGVKDLAGNRLFVMANLVLKFLTASLTYFSDDNFQKS